MKTICSSGFAISLSDKKAWDNYLLEDPATWTLKALKGLINKATKTIIKDWLEVYKAQAVGNISAKPEVLIPAIIAMDEFSPVKLEDETAVKCYNREATEKRCSCTKEAKTVSVCAGGFQIEDYEDLALRAFYIDPEEALKDYFYNKIALRRKAFIEDSNKKLMADKTVDEFPADNDALINFVCARPDYKTRAECEAIK